ncbi:hypothetical protein GUITHDRAFT_101644 [Guillardia theta CCMP2712]|uniref:Right handed beta helix domain-containing protein n=1 Tax=Guillardia theta (strain CCMP2712) TaxID=905079 RepID=L1JVR1_GUITC|nr:hypothetical protein GUITHDRAFT_101644 [Guillardia theta CCMP2712]EKX52472.1 hypothetical protein GUITHDRAFT_101644 [Guillardia theta CCMP2712]|eukprot:XP_005839452.1 hypothetical protein GUITHDRAFT_101644 [Guillardia theta CCMP2712]
MIDRYCSMLWFAQRWQPTLLLLLAVCLVFPCLSQKVPSWIDMDSTFRRNKRSTDSFCMTCVQRTLFSYNSNAAFQLLDTSNKLEYWTEITAGSMDGPGPKSGFQLVMTSVGDSLYVLGIYDITVTQSRTVELYELNMSTNTWTNYTSEMRGSVPGQQYSYSFSPYIVTVASCQRSLFAAGLTAVLQLDLDTLIWSDVTSELPRVWFESAQWNAPYLSEYQGDIYMSAVDVGVSHMLVNRGCGTSGWEVYFSLAEIYNSAMNIIMSGVTIISNAAGVIPVVGMLRFNRNYTDVAMMLSELDSTNTFVHTPCDDGNIYIVDTSNEDMYIMRPEYPKVLKVSNSGGAGILPEDQLTGITNFVLSRSLISWGSSLVTQRYDGTYQTFDMHSLTWSQINMIDTYSQMSQIIPQYTTSSTIFSWNGDLYGFTDLQGGKMYKYGGNGTWSQHLPDVSVSLDSYLLATVAFNSYNLLPDYASAVSDSFYAIQFSIQVENYFYGEPVTEADVSNGGVYLYYPATGNWNRYSVAKGAPLKYRNSIAATDRFVYHFGGANVEVGSQIAWNVDQVMDSWLYCFDLEGQEWIILSKSQTNSPTPRLHPSMVVYKTKLFVYGGIINYDTANFWVDLYSFDLETLTWTELFSKNDRQDGAVFVGLVISMELHSMIGLYYIPSPTTIDLMLTSRKLPMDRESTGHIMLDLLTSYDWDTILLPPCSHAQACLSLVSQLTLCDRSWMPCFLSLKGSNSGITLFHDAAILCDAKQGCSGISASNLTLFCSGYRQGTNAALRMLSVGAHLELDRVSVFGCSSQDDGGSVQLYGGATGALASRRFVGSSSAGSGGAIMLQGSTMSIVDSTFEDCWASAGGGAIALRSQPVDYFPTVMSRPVLLVDRSRFLTNSAVDGGALRAENGSMITIRSSVFSSNTVSRNGGAMYLQASDARLEDDQFLHNEAVGGGGGAVLWEQREPVVVHQKEFMSSSSLCTDDQQGNKAFYGPCIASGFHLLQLEAAENSFYPGILFSLNVTKFDFYRQQVRTDSQASLQVQTVRLSSSSGDALVVESKSINLKEGAAVFDMSVKSYFIASSRFPFVQVSGNPAIEVFGLDAASGLQIQSNPIEMETSPAVCPAGYVLKADSASFPAFAVCDRCSPDSYALNAFSGSNSTQLACLRCPHGVSCQGGEEVFNEAGFWFNRSILLRPEMQRKTLRAYKCAEGSCFSHFVCKEGQEGRLCGLCKQAGPKDDYFWSLHLGVWLADVSCRLVRHVYNETVCDGSGRIWIFLLPLLKYLGIVSAITQMVDEPEKKEEEKGRTGFLFQWLRVHRTKIGYIKILIGFVQVSSSLISIYNIRWPDLIARLLTNIAFISFDFISLPQISCTASDLSFLDRLLLYTVAPLGPLLLLSFPHLITVLVKRPHSEDLSRDLLYKLMFWSMFFIYIIYIPVSAMVVSTFLCQDLGDDGNWLARDLRVPCPRTSASFSYGWAILMTLVYPVGFPLVILTILYRLKVPRLAQAKHEHAFFQTLSMMTELEQVNADWKDM